MTSRKFMQQTASFTNSLPSATLLLIHMYVVDKSEGSSVWKRLMVMEITYLEEKGMKTKNPLLLGLGYQT